MCHCWSPQTDHCDTESEISRRVNCVLSVFCVWADVKSSVQSVCAAPVYACVRLCVCVSVCVYACVCVACLRLSVVFVFVCTNFLQNEDDDRLRKKPTSDDLSKLRLTSLHLHLRNKSPDASCL